MSRENGKDSITEEPLIENPIDAFLIRRDYSITEWGTYNSLRNATGGMMLSSGAGLAVYVQDNRVIHAHPYPPVYDENAEYEAPLMDFTPPSP